MNGKFGQNHLIENYHTDKSKIKVIHRGVNNEFFSPKHTDRATLKSFKEKYTQEQESKVYLRYIPSSLLDDIQYSYVPLAEVFLYHKDILSHIDEL